MEVNDALEILSVTRDTEEKQIRRAYLKLVKRHKPEKDPEGFRRVREAYELLSSGDWWRDDAPENEVFFELFAAGVGRTRGLSIPEEAYERPEDFFPPEALLDEAIYYAPIQDESCGPDGQPSMDAYVAREEQLPAEPGIDPESAADLLRDAESAGRRPPADLIDRLGSAKNAWQCLAWAEDIDPRFRVDFIRALSKKWNDFEHGVALVLPELATEEELERAKAERAISNGTLVAALVARLETAEAAHLARAVLAEDRKPRVAASDFIFLLLAFEDRGEHEESDRLWAAWGGDIHALRWEVSGSSRGRLDLQLLSQYFKAAEHMTPSAREMMGEVIAEGDWKDLRKRQKSWMKVNPEKANEADGSAESALKDHAPALAKLIYGSPSPEGPTEWSQSRQEGSNDAATLLVLAVILIAIIVAVLH